MDYVILCFPLYYITSHQQVISRHSLGFVDVYSYFIKHLRGAT